MNLCKYKDVFGKVGEGVHSYRILNVAVVDLGFTILFALLIYFYLSQSVSFILILIFLLILGIFFHYIFCVKTTINKLLFY